MKKLILLLFLVQFAAFAQCPPTGDQTTYGNGTWIGHVYQGANNFTANYKGYFTTPSDNFNLNFGNVAVAGPNLCGTYQNDFSIRFKMTKNFTAGLYKFTVGGDDGFRLSIDGGVTFLAEASDYNNGGYRTRTSNVVCLNGDTNLVIEYYQGSGGAQVSFSYTQITNPSPEIADIVAYSCANTTLSVSGATTDGYMYQWGSGADGVNIISGQTTSIITVTPPAPNTRYWVRRLAVGNCSPESPIKSIVVSPSTNLAPTADTFGDNIWKVYAYAATIMNPDPSTYRGFYNQNTLSANTQDTANGGWNNQQSPSVNIAAWTGCPVTNDNFTFIHKRKGFPCGRYDLTMVNWDDATKVFIDGIEVFTRNVWNSGAMQSLGTRYLNANSTIEIKTIEGGGGANVRLDILPANSVASYNGTTWTGTPEGSAVIVSSNLDLANNLNVCSCIVNNGAILTINPGQTLIVQNNLNVAADSNLIVENNGSLVQVNDLATSMGSITVKRSSTPMKQFDYTYWSSPVSGFALSNFLPSNLYYAFNPATGVNNWVSQPANTVMEIAKGYIVRAPVNSLATQIINSTFAGIPNTGPINASIVKGNVGKFNLIGNPYPSALDADLFLSNPNNASKITGIIYLWTHNTAIAANTPNPGSGTFAYTSNDYAKYNLTGATKGLAAMSGGVSSTGKIASGQGFFVEASDALSVGSHNLVFNNSMRLQKTNSNSEFFRPALVAAPATIAENPFEKNRLWLNLTNTQGAYDEMLLGYITGATNGMDYGYDGKVFSAGNFVSIYSILGSEKLSIQGKSLNFDENEIIPLGYSNTIGGTFSIGLENVDGFFNNKNVYLLDKANNVSTNLKLGRYTFTTQTGTFDNRFELKFIDATLSVGDAELSANSIIIFNNNHEIEIQSKEQPLASVQIFDLLGRLIYQKNKINSLAFKTSEINVRNQVIIVKVRTDNDLELVKKVILN